MNSPRRSSISSAARLIPQIRRIISQRDEAVAEAEKQRAKVARLEEKVTSLSEHTKPGSKLNYLFVVAYGRSGSTLIQGILSSTPGVVVRGENGDAIYSLFKYHRGLERARTERSTGSQLSPQNPWFGIDGYLEDSAIEHIRNLVVLTLLRPSPDTRIIGFKEIRWWHEDWREYMAFLREVFPGARFIINTRNHEEVAVSKWWADKDRARLELDRYEDILNDLVSELGPSNAYRVHYDDYVRDPATLEGMFRWLGEPFDLMRVREVMSHKHSY